ncbi:GH92 family glycosyl hydrolase [Bacteroides sp. A1-P5]|uniref:GH92 family glycosyl hydrolase n=3 Tax=Bacteroides TaxID=816 RepID=A0ABU5HRN5_9BACE|nr:MULTISPECIES: GH92 family glycosyl hydrolase [unclassified Bacteroides]MDY7252981.1 GH92 family glycosyl hydrolase [Bacteroides sp. A1-P5]MDY7258664.1 GH92 family glycosyl hydrolase [Bacteroides sp. A2-P53]
MKRLFFSFLLIIFVVLYVRADKTLWEIGEKNNSSAEFALGPSGYTKFLANDFGYEDRYFLIGGSDVSKDFPYVLPGPADQWGGTGGTSGWRTHDATILFDLANVPKSKDWKLVVDLLGASPIGAVVKIRINSVDKRFVVDGGVKEVLEGDLRNAKNSALIFPIPADELKKGGNTVVISVLEGGWIVFDQIRLVGPEKAGLGKLNKKVFLRGVSPAPYEIEENGRRYQPLLIDAEHLAGNPKLRVELDGLEIFSADMDTARYQFEALMPAVYGRQKSMYKVWADNDLLYSDIVVRNPQQLQSCADYVDTKIGTGHSRWMIAPGPWMPFSMVKLSPDNQNAGWQSGYQPTFETIGCFSHIHEWTMGGLGMMPTNGELQIRVGDELRPDEGYRSRIDKKTEEAPLGYYKVYMTDTKIWVENTATTRASFQRYTFPKDKDGRVMIDLQIPTEYDYKLMDVEIKKISDYRIEGYSHQLSPRPNVWSGDADQEYVVNFVIEFDTPIKNVGGWVEDKVLNRDHIEGKDLKYAGLYVEFDTKQTPVVQVRTGISLVSIANASENLEEEISRKFGWDFASIVQNQKQTWNEILGRVQITSNDRLEKVRFYTNMYRSYCRNIWSDVNGEWMSADKKVQKLADPNHRALGCDAFWNTFWNLNQVWNLVTPEWASRWVNSQLALYETNGWLAKGPAGMKYIPVMVAEHEIPLIVSTYQMGIRDYDVNKAFRAVKKMQTTPATHVAGGFAGNRDLIPYLQYHYVPIEKGRFSNSLEYSYDDWTVAQFAKSLGKYEDYKMFSQRGSWWKNAINPKNGYVHMRDTLGNFVEKFDPFRSGCNIHYVEGNAWQLSFFVPQDIPGLIDIIGKNKFVNRLNWGFSASEPWRYNAPNDQYWDFPVVQGNQQSMHFAFLFNWAGQPWLTQKWVRSVIDRYYGYGIANAYLGDEDQGQMSAWFVMAAIGLFQTDGGCKMDPVYEIASPLYEKTVIKLGRLYNRGEQFMIVAKNVSRKNKYIQSAVLNGEKLDHFYFPASELLKGGELILEMGDTPNKAWGVVK